MKGKKQGPTPVKMVLVLVSVAVIFAAVLAAVNQITRPTIERNAREKL
ncbi:MAG: hypothetical protein GWO44_05120, partial [Thermoplasmata archaeon]|nr:hypothetical protein [Thermoplasmata archaeon]NIY02670.1 hypothetical protein [Thermoplasmata archaeon]